MKVCIHLDAHSNGAWLGWETGNLIRMCAQRPENISPLVGLSINACTHPVNSISLSVPFMANNCTALAIVLAANVPAKFLGTVEQRQKTPTVWLSNPQDAHRNMWRTHEMRAFTRKVGREFVLHTYYNRIPQKFNIWEFHPRHSQSCSQAHTFVHCIGRRTFAY